MFVTLFNACLLYCVVYVLCVHCVACVVCRVDISGCFVLWRLATMLVVCSSDSVDNRWLSPSPRTGNVLYPVTSSACM